MMKKPLIAAIATMAVAAGAQAESKFYGKMNVSVGYDDTSEGFALEDHASRLGVKGSDDIGNAKVIYQAEFGRKIDGENTISSRDAFVGLSYGDKGTVKMGIMDTPLKKSQGKFDLFNDVVDINQVLAGENRLANSLNYTTAKMGAVQASISAVFGEGSSDGLSGSVIYKEGDIYAAVAFDDNTSQVRTIRATGIFTMGDMRFGVLVNNVDEADTADAKMGYAVNASLKMGKNTAKVQFAKGDQGKQTTDNGLVGPQNLSLGLDHKLAKTTKAYAVVNLFDSDAADTDQMNVGVGLEHKF